MENEFLLLNAPPPDTTCCFTGYRPQKLPWKNNEADPACLRLKASVCDAIDAAYAAGYRHFICGMAAGADIYFGEAVVSLRPARPGMTLEAAVPFAGQEQRWAAAWKARYRALADACDRITVLREKYTRQCMIERNRYMVDRSGLVIAVYDGKPGGTKNTLLYAEACERTIIQLPVPDC